MLTIATVIYVLGLVFGGIYLARHLDQNAPPPGPVRHVPALVPMNH